MRSTTGRSGHETSPAQLFGDAPGTTEGPDRQHAPGACPESPRVLRARADLLLDRLRALERASAGGGRVDIDGIDAVADRVQALQTAFAAVATRDLLADQVAELAGLRRSINAALLLTLVMLERVR